MNVIDYYKNIFEKIHFKKINDKSNEGNSFYKMISEFGEGTLNCTNFNNMFLILFAEFTPKNTFLKTSEIKENYLEISLFETDDSFYKVGKRKIKKVNKGIVCFINTSKEIQVYCEANKLTKFTKIIIAKEYYDKFLKQRYKKIYKNSTNAINFLSQNPNRPEISFIFEQIQSCKAVGIAQHIYMESKILELLALVTDIYEKNNSQNNLPVKLDKKDISSLNKVVSFMKKDLAYYPSTKELSTLASMSVTRFQMAFRKIYGTTPYEYLKDMRMNSSLQFLKNTEYSIKEIAKLVGYTNAGHFAGLFKKTYGLTPKQYRSMK